LVKNSENSDSGLNEKRFFGSPDGKIPIKSTTAQRVVPVSQLERPSGNFLFNLQISRPYCSYHQFHAFRGLLRATSPKYHLDLEIAKKSNFSKLTQNEALRPLVTKVLFKAR